MHTPRKSAVCWIRPARCQLGHVGNVGVGKAPAHFQHRTDTLQKNRTALDRHSVRSGRDDFQLGVGQTKHGHMMPQGDTRAKPSERGKPLLDINLWSPTIIRCFSILDSDSCLGLARRFVCLAYWEFCS